MVFKAAIALIAISIIISSSIVASFWYFKRKAELKHEEKMKQMDYNEKIITETQQDSIDKELEKEKRK